MAYATPLFSSLLQMRSPIKTIKRLMKKHIVIISGPSGAGEDSIIHGLERMVSVEKVVTTTSRPMRPGESEGHPYHFISRELFLEKIAADEFFEYAEEDNHHLYGVTRGEVERIKQSTQLVVWKMDYQGVMTMKKLLPEAISILILAPLEVLAQRIRQRDQVTEAFVQGRLAHARGWFEHRDIFDYEVENVQGKLDETIAQVAEIIRKSTGIDL
jgi:guanylate kinase